MITVPMPVSVSSHTIPLSVSSSIRPLVNTNYDALINKPQINGVELSGNKTSADLGIDQTYTHNQLTASAIWSITHDLNKFPSVTVVDSGGSVVVGDITYLDNNHISISFSGAFSGTAYLN